MTERTIKCGKCQNEYEVNHSELSFYCSKCSEKLDVGEYDVLRFVSHEDIMLREIQAIRNSVVTITWMMIIPFIISAIYVIYSLLLRR